MRELSPYLLERTIPPPGVDAAAHSLNPPSADGPEIGLLDYWRTIRKHARLIGAVTLALVLLTGLVVFVETSVYTATTTVLIERNTPQVLNIRQIIPESFQDEPEASYYKTQYELLKGRALAATVIKEQGLEHNEFIAPDSRRTDGLISGAVASVKSWLAGFMDEGDGQDREDIGGVKSRTIDNYLKRLAVAPTRGTRLVTIQFTSPDPKLSARVANAHAVAYIRQGLELHSNTNEEAQRFLEAKLVELKTRVEKSEAALNAYRRENGVISLNYKEDVVVQKFGELSKDLTEAEARRISLEAQEKLVESHRYDSLPAVLGNELIQHLKEDAARVEAEYAHLAEEFQPGLPQLDELRAKLDQTRARLRREIQNVVDGVESAYQAAVTNENELRAAVEEQKALVLQQKDIGVQYGILAREVNTNRQLYNSVLQRMKETEVAADLSASNIFVVDKAGPPRRHSHPRRLADLLISAMLGLVAGIGIAFFRESLDNTLKSPQEVERLLRLPNLATLPDLTAAAKLEPARLNGKSPAQLPTRLYRDSNTTSVAWCAESYRTLRNSVMLSQAGGPPRVVLITSALNAEGKTVVAVNTAACFARSGIKVLLIDADLRRPRCHEMLEVKNDDVGLSEVLAGQAQLEKAIVATSVAGLSALLAGAIPPDPAELVGSRKMQETLTQLREAYDFIVIDSAPTMLVSDAIPLSAMVDGTLMVVNSHETPRHAVMEACSRLRYVGAKVLGVVLNRVDVRSFDFFHTSYYYGRYENSYYKNGHDARV